MFIYMTAFITTDSIYADTTEQLLEKKLIVDEKIERLNEQVEQLQQKRQAEIELFERTNEEIESSTIKITEIKQQIEDRKDIISERLIVYQEKDSNFTIYLEAIMGSESITDLIGRVSSVQAIISADQALIESQQEDQRQLEDTQKKLLSLNEQQQQLFQDMQEQEGELQLLIAESEVEAMLLLEEIYEAGGVATNRFILEQRVKNLRMLNENIDIGAVENPPDQLAGIAQGIENAEKYLGMPYVWGGMHPSTSFDCSGLIQWAYGQAGISVPRTTGEQYLATLKVKRSDVLPGDLIFFSYGKGIAHVGIYIGNGKMLNSQNSGVMIESLDWWEKYLVGFGRVT